MPDLATGFGYLGKLLDLLRMNQNIAETHVE